MSTHEDAGDTRYRQIVKAVAETPWAIVPERLAAIVELVSYRAEGRRFSDEEIQERIGAGPAQRKQYAAGSVAVLPLYGVMTPRADLFSKISGGTSVSEFKDAFQSAVNDPAVDAILIEIDSPGGSTDLVPELAAAVRAARGRKPIVAIANTDANSAAYWVGAQADELVVTPSGNVGSIGVFAAHQDVSAAQEKLGVKTTLVSAGKFKTETSPFIPLSEEAASAIQARVDEFYGMFVRDVAKGRGVAVDAVRNGYGQGRVLTAKQALDAGMVDRVATFDETLASVARRAAASADQVAIDSEELRAGEPPGERETITLPEAAKSGLSFADESERALAHVSSLVTRAQALAALRRADGRDLSAASRERLSALHASLDEAAGALAELLAEPVNHEHAEAVVREIARFEALRATA